MDRAGLKQKFNFLRNSLHTLHELLMMLDSDSSGSLSVGELRTSLMAFSEMGLITEEVELQPLSGAYEGNCHRFCV
jgi:Ca2+-binding EF-hand superfamily protein